MVKGLLNIFSYIAFFIFFPLCKLADVLFKSRTEGYKNTGWQKSETDIRPEAKIADSFCRYFKSKRKFHLIPFSWICIQLSKSLTKRDSSGKISESIYEMH